MVYNKPELTYLGSADTLVLGGTPNLPADGASQTTTAGAAFEFED